MVLNSFICTLTTTSLFYNFHGHAYWGESANFDRRRRKIWRGSLEDVLRGFISFFYCNSEKKKGTSWHIKHDRGKLKGELSSFWLFLWFEVLQKPSLGTHSYYFHPISCQMKIVFFCCFSFHFSLCFTFTGKSLIFFHLSNLELWQEANGFFSGASTGDINQLESANNVQISRCLKNEERNNEGRLSVSSAHIRAQIWFAFWGDCRGVELETVEKKSRGSWHGKPSN